MTGPQERILACRGCGATKPVLDGSPTDSYPSGHCDQCPPWQCETCGATCTADALCPCWTRVQGSLADIKAALAAAGLSVEVHP